MLTLAAPPALADPPTCPIPDDLALHDLALPATRAAVATGHLTILTVGGAASAGQAAQGADFTYPARLSDHLRAAFPKLDLEVISRAAPHRTAAMEVDHLAADIAQTHAKLVIWAIGAIEAGSGMDVDAMATEVQQGIDLIRAAGADPLLVDLQYAPSIARLVDLPPYREAVQRVGAANDVPVLDRYELMRGWSEDGVLDLDATDKAARVQVARRLFDCLAMAMASGIAGAVR